MTIFIFKNDCFYTDCEYAAAGEEVGSEAQVGNDNTQLHHGDGEAAAGGHGRRDRSSAGGACQAAAQPQGTREAASSQQA